MVFNNKKIKKMRELLELPNEYTLKELRTAYYKKAILYHPDKNTDGEEMFKKINDAYVFLQKHFGTEIEEELNYKNLIKKCILSIYPDCDWDSIFIETTINSILINIKNISEKFFENISKEKSIEIYKFLSFFPISDEIKKKIKEIIQKKIKNDNIVILNPSLNDLLNDNVYKLEIENQSFFIPLWFPEVYYDLSDNDLIVQCIPELDNNVMIDKKNNLHVSVNYSITELLKKKNIDIMLGNKKFIIQVNELKIKKLQNYIFYESGILKQSDNMFSSKHRGDIIIYIYLT